MVGASVRAGYDWLWEVPMLSIDHRRDILAARRRFFDGRPVSDDDVPAPILNSWRRCSERGFDIHLPPHLEPMTVTEMRQAMQRHEVLQRLCRPEIEALHAEAQLTDCIVILTDAEGLILDTVGNLDFADRAAQVALRPGVPWAEATTGTNAIGAALIEGRPIKVHGIEHFFEPHGFLSCSAAPIFDPFGQIAGALDMSGPALANQDHALGLVRLAVDQIEHRFFDSGFEGGGFDRCEIMRFHRDPGLIGTTQEGILVFQDSRLIAGNRRGLDLLDLDRHALNRQSFDDLFDMQHVDGVARGATARQHLRSQSGEAFFAQRQVPHASSQARSQARSQRGLPAPLQRLAPPPRQVEPVFDGETKAALQRGIRLIDADIPLLLRGETGSGKEIFAREIHRASQRAGRPFIAVNCAALPEGLIESELFGYEEGAFSGARRRGAKGLIREAANGLLFLDEIGDMPLPLQSRLLRVLQEREVRPLGGGIALPVDFSLICASHRDLLQMVTQGSFRADLYFRIAQYTMSLPALRDIADRSHVLAKIWQGLSGESGVTLAPASLDLLLRYDWPGNFREAVSMLRALIALAEPGSEITPDLLPAAIFAATPATPRDDTIEPAHDLRHLQRTAIQNTLADCNGNISQAARRLGVHRSTIYRQLLAGHDPIG
jgi:transcriptional regulator of acetoin/glycerol metabolism